MALCASEGFPPGHRDHAAQPRAWRLAELEAHRQRLGLQSARSDQEGQRPAASACLVVVDGRGAQEATPLVHDGVMYLPNPHGVIQALDAATGDLIWEYRPAARTEGNGVQRNIAIYEDKIFATTYDAHIVAVDARTGKLVWDTRVADPKLGYEYTSGPIVVRGKVIAGITGCSHYKEDVCFITGHDAGSGKEVWRTSTVARPGEPGGETWGDLPLSLRAGSDAWISGSYDADTNLIYWGTAQAKPWARAVRGTDGDALYTNSTLALDPDTGKMKWYYQHLPGETQDMDEVFESILIDSADASRFSRWASSASSGSSTAPQGSLSTRQTSATKTSSRSVRRQAKFTYRPDKIPRIGVELEMCPSTAGFKDWRAMAFSPQTNALYIPWR